MIATQPATVLAASRNECQVKLRFVPAAERDYRVRIGVSGLPPLSKREGNLSSEGRCVLLVPPDASADVIQERGV
jgi:hypothetical protein